MSEGATVAVVGAGPAGLRAVEALVRHGLRPVLLDEAMKCGGQIYRQPPDGAERPAAELYGLEAGKAVRLHALLPALADRIDYRPRTLVWNIARNGARFRLDTVCNDVAATIDADRVVLATGAVDRVLPFPGWTLPGVYTLGAAQIALKAQGVAIGRRVALVGAGPLLPLLVTQYLAAGIEPAAVLDVTPLKSKITAAPGLVAAPGTAGKGLYYLAKGWIGGVRMESGIRAIRALGQERVTGLAYTRSDGSVREIACDGIAASFGLRSEAQLADLAGCDFTFDAASRQWQPVRDGAGRASVAGLYLAGDGAAIGGADVAELAGARAGLAVVADLGGAVDEAAIRRLDRSLQRQARFRRALEAAYPFPGHLLDAAADDTLVCRCEGVSMETLRKTIDARGPSEVNRLKAFTRSGMGRCQGRMCGHVGAEILAWSLGGDIVGAGRLRAQAPVKPLPVAALLEREAKA